MADHMNGAAWIGGNLVPIADAKIGVTDWGLTHSDITYDVVQVWDGAFFRLEDHLDRFAASMKKTRITVSETRAEIEDILQKIVASSGLRHAYCAFVASRGAQTVPGSRDPRTCKTHFYAWVVPYVDIFTADVLSRGARLQLAEHTHRISPHAVDPSAKNYHWGDMTSALFEALDQGYDSVVLADASGHVTEGPGFNVFGVTSGRVFTAKSGVLEGITRKTTLEICAQLHIPCQARDVPIAELLAADEVFITSSGGGPLPIANLNGRVLNGGAAGPIFCRIQEAYRSWRMNPVYRTPIAYPDATTDHES